MLRVMRDMTKRALEAGVLGPIDTHYESVTDGNVSLRVARITNLERKKKARFRAGNPFLNPEEELLLPMTLPLHHVLLNKFPVMADHALIVTKEFASQAEPLSLDDFRAMVDVRRASEGQEEWLFFYNHGPLSGQSQPHKHIQIIPYPIEGASRLEDVYNGKSNAEALAFQHFWSACEAPAYLDAEALYALYKDLLLHATRMSASNNFLMTRERMLIVPRSAEVTEGISMNSLAFAFALLSPDEAGFERLKLEKLHVLEEVCFPREGGQSLTIQ